MKKIIKESLYEFKKNKSLKNTTKDQIGINYLYNGIYVKFDIYYTGEYYDQIPYFQGTVEAKYKDNSYKHEYYDVEIIEIISDLADFFEENLDISLIYDLQNLDPDDINLELTSLIENLIYKCTDFEFLFVENIEEFEELINNDNLPTLTGYIRFYIKSGELKCEKIN